MDAQHAELLTRHLQQWKEIVDNETIEPANPIALSQSFEKQWEEIQADPQLGQPKERDFAFTEIPLLHQPRQDEIGPWFWRVVIEMKDSDLSLYFNHALTYSYLIARFRHDVLDERHMPILVYSLLLGPTSFYLQKLVVYHMNCEQELTEVPSPENRNVYFRSMAMVYVDHQGRVHAENLALLKGFLSRDYYQDMDAVDEEIVRPMSQE
ncbi:hypothetical protein HK104_011178 [Borealophlyctis nickersoniae]|nr:hypothetical protein HK104_011178 [Borealophlyctis nickersoniae]